MSTINDVAREAKVSVATVSRVVNNTAQVSEETEKRVLDAIAKLKYKPSALARNFRCSQSHLVLILAPNIMNPYYSKVITGIEDVARKFGYNALLCITGGNGEKEREYLDMLAVRNADGAILLMTECSDNLIYQVSEIYPIVQCSEFYAGTKVPHVSIDYYKAARYAVNYMIKSGHTEIGLISSTSDYMSTKMIYKGYVDELKAANIRFNEKYIQYAADDYSFQSGLKAAHQLLSLKKRPTAIFCVSDILALGTVRAAENLKIKIPSELTVIGFDNVEYSKMFKPYISTISLPCYDLGKRSMELLFDLLSGRTEITGEVILDYELVIRDSSGPNPQKAFGKTRADKFTARARRASDVTARQNL